MHVPQKKKLSLLNDRQQNHPHKHAGHGSPSLPGQHRNIGNCMSQQGNSARYYLLGSPESPSSLIQMQRRLTHSNATPPVTMPTTMTVDEKTQKKVNICGSSFILVRFITRFVKNYFKRPFNSMCPIKKENLTACEAVMGS